MSPASTGNVPRLFELTDDEAVTLRRIAFNQSDMRSLRRADIDRLVKLRLVAQAGNNLVLTISGKEHFDALPRPLFADRPRQRNGW